MAVRRHVTASVAEENRVREIFRAVLGESFDQVPIEAGDAWRFFVTSVWSVSASALCKGLQELNQVGLQATTEDGSRWYLTLIQAPAEPVRFLHEFHLFSRERDSNEQGEPIDDEEELDPRLAFLQPDVDLKIVARPASQFDQIAVNYAEMGCPISDEFRDRVKDMPLGEAINCFREYEADRLESVLAQANVEFDSAELRNALLWKETTPQEQDSDIGNLPRVLMAIGLAGSMSEFVANAELAASESASEMDSSFDEDEVEYEEEDDDEFDDADQIDDFANGGERFLQKTLAAAEQQSPVQLKGKPVAIKPTEISLLDFFSQAILVNEYPALVIEMRFPPGFDSAAVKVKKSGWSDLEFQRTDTGWLIGVRSLDRVVVSTDEDWQKDDLRENLGDELTDLFRVPPDGTVVEIYSAEPEQLSTCLRFGGSISNGNWLIDRTWPQMDHADLVAALELARNQEAEHYELRDEVEADAIMHAVERDNYLHNMGVKRVRQRVSCEYDGLGFMAKLILRHRFAHVWNFAPVLAKTETEYEERKKLERTMRRSAVKLRRDQDAPCDKRNVIFRGDASVYWPAEMEKWTKIEATPRETFDAAMREMKFEYLGDFVCKKVRDHMLRCYVSPDRMSYGLLMANAFGYPGFEFVSHFENDAHLTTSTSWMAQSHPEIDVYAQFEPGLAAPQLYEKHQWAVQRFIDRKATTPLILEPSLIGLAKLFDDQLVKMATVESGLISFDKINIDQDQE